MVAGRFDAAKFAAARITPARTKQDDKIAALNTEAGKLLDAGKFDEALAKADELQRAIPPDETLRHSKTDMLRAAILAGKGDIDGALARLAAFARANPDNGSVQYTVLLHILRDGAYKNKRAAALPYATRIVALHGESPTTNMILAEAEYAAGNKDAAIVVLEKIAKNPDLPDKAFETTVSLALAAVKADKPWPTDK